MTPIPSETKSLSVKHKLGDVYLTSLFLRETFIPFTDTPLVDFFIDKPVRDEPYAPSPVLLGQILNKTDRDTVHFFRPTLEQQYRFNLTGQTIVLHGYEKVMTLQAFFKNEIALPSNYFYDRDPTLDLGNMFYRDLPNLRVGSFSWNFVSVEVKTENLDLLELATKRLNISVS